MNCIKRDDESAQRDVSRILGARQKKAGMDFNPLLRSIGELSKVRPGILNPLHWSAVGGGRSRPSRGGRA